MVNTQFCQEWAASGGYFPKNVAQKWRGEYLTAEKPALHCLSPWTTTHTNRDEVMWIYSSSKDTGPKNSVITMALSSDLFLSETHSPSLILKKHHKQVSEFHAIKYLISIAPRQHIIQKPRKKKIDKKRFIFFGKADIERRRWRKNDHLSRIARAELI